MKSYTLTENHATFLHEQKNPYQSRESIHIILKQVELLIKADAVALYLYNTWTDCYMLSGTTSSKTIQFVEKMTSDSVKAVNSQHRFAVVPGTEVMHVETEQQVCIIGLGNHIHLNGYLVLFVEEDNNHLENQQEQFIQIAEEMNTLLIELTNTYNAQAQANKYELMYNVTQKFHSTMNPKDVLSEIIETIRSIYPQFNCNLFLSKNYQGDQDLPVKELIYNEEYADKASVQAFLTGEIKLDQKPNQNKINLYAPLNGKQGIYGVMQLTAVEIDHVPNEDIEFVRLLANTAGNALENAQLYQQSNQLIQDLQLINTFVHELNKLNGLLDITAFIKKQFKESFKTDEIGFLLANPSVGYKIESASTQLFHRDDSRDFVDELYSLVQKEQDAVFIGDYATRYGEHHYYSSVILLPMIQTDKLIGLIAVLHPKPYFFSFDQFKLMKSLTYHATLAFENTLLREQLELSVITDYLTKLYSRKYLDERCMTHLSHDQQGVFILIDLDDFKKVNDLHGHDVGDHILIQVSDIIRDRIEDNGFAARWGGEELAIYLPHKSAREGKAFVTQLLDLIKRLTKPTITASIGMAFWNSECKVDFITLFDMADQALYRAKRSGKNQFQIEP
ncbi:sensor domain-containing diguanylate cyclase [Amphibacillus cookii]|uniref:sensor domain-containing diguanylate cyclase n=1 Tax=Amphibacillus cookii TaxID=767787 RepID=UPI00195EEB71|nr:sensor domain-containing diguanylate cyclase [Amphibacillus cookii]MBM7543025.1 diguanylate cyclase (GGDEF)-like protein [Amphibacillus cookii]